MPPFRLKVGHRYFAFENISPPAFANHPGDQYIIAQFESRTFFPPHPQKKLPHPGALKKIQKMS